MIEKAKKKAIELGLCFRLMFQDEARFGRSNTPRRCWAPEGFRPNVPKQIVREYTYAYTVSSPVDGVTDSLILPSMTTEAMNVFLAEVSNRHRGELILMLCDGASCHSENSLKIPGNIILEKLPPYCPQLNPVESIWEEIREKFFPNLVFSSMDALEEKLVEALLWLENNFQKVQSIVGFDWIINQP